MRRQMFIPYGRKGRIHNFVEVSGVSSIYIFKTSFFDDFIHTDEKYDVLDNSNFYDSFALQESYFSYQI